MKPTVCLMLGALAVVVGGCGVRGPLDPPPGPAGAPSPTAQAESGQGKKANEAPKPHQGFILDGLIR